MKITLKFYLDIHFLLGLLDFSNVHVTNQTNIKI